MNSSSQGKQDVPCLRGKRARVDVCEMKLSMSAKVRWCRASLARKEAFQNLFCKQQKPVQGFEF